MILIFSLQVDGCRLCQAVLAHQTCNACCQFHDMAHRAECQATPRLPPEHLPSVPPGPSAAKLPARMGEKELLLSLAVDCREPTEGPDVERAYAGRVRELVSPCVCMLGESVGCREIKRARICMFLSWLQPNLLRPNFSTINLPGWRPRSKAVSSQGCKSKKTPPDGVNSS